MHPRTEQWPKLFEEGLNRLFVMRLRRRDARYQLFIRARPNVGMTRPGGEFQRRLFAPDV